MSSETPAGDGAEAVPGKRCELRLLYIKDLSFECPHVPGILFGHEQPELVFSIESGHQFLENDLFDVVLGISVHATSGDKSLFLIELKQGGLFEISGYSDQEIISIIKTKALEALYPYAREMISSLAGHGGFPRLKLGPLNFEALYADARAARQKAEPTGPD